MLQNLIATDPKMDCKCIVSDHRYRKKQITQYILDKSSNNDAIESSVKTTAPANRANAVTFPMMQIADACIDSSLTC